MTPHLVKWDKTLRKKGLTIIDVNSGRGDTKKDLAAYVKKNKKKYPTLWDRDGAVCKKFGIKGYPAAFLIGADGKVVWEGWPNAELSDLPGLIAKELAKAKKMKEATPAAAKKKKKEKGKKAKTKQTAGKTTQEKPAKKAK